MRRLEIFKEEKNKDAVINMCKQKRTKKLHLDKKEKERRNEEVTFKLG